MNRYRFYNFVDFAQNVEGQIKDVIRNIFLEFETTADQPLRAFNEFRKAHANYDFLIENTDQIYLRDGFQFIPVSFEDLKKVAEQSRPHVLFSIEKEPFLNAISR